MRKKTNLVYGAGLNDANYEIGKKVDGKLVICRFYSRWAHMISRCYNKKHHLKQPTYENCTVCEEWLSFSNFKAWMEQQDWEGKELDKDLLFIGNKLYSPETCVFVSSTTNGFTLDCRATKGDWPIGVSFHKFHNKFGARCQNPFIKKLEHLGYFECPQMAHEAWRKRKHELACQLADLQTDDRVANALRTRYLEV